MLCTEWGYRSNIIYTSFAALCKSYVLSDDFLIYKM